jgi:hypothetical protein
MEKLKLNEAEEKTTNCWNLATTRKGISISADGLNATKDSNATVWQSVCAEKGFHISADFSSPAILHYFEVTNMSSYKW